MAHSSVFVGFLSNVCINLFLVFHRKHSQQVQHLLLWLHILRVPQPDRRHHLALPHAPVPQPQISNLRVQRLALLSRKLKTLNNVDKLIKAFVNGFVVYYQNNRN
jgi:hypothetical protein